MHAFQSLLVVVVASLALVSTTPQSSALASQVDVPYGHYAHLAARSSRRSVHSVVTDHGRRLKAKRATQAQQEAAARAKQWSDNFAKQNSAWQQAANADLAQGKTPQDFDTWASSHGGRDGNGNDSPDGGDDSQQQQQGQQQGQQQDEGDDGDDGDDGEDSGNDSGSDSGSQSQSSSTSQASPTSTASQSEATANKKQAYKQDNNNNNQQQQQSQQQQGSQNQSQKQKQSQSQSQSSGSSGSGLLAGIKNLVTGGQVTYYNTGLGACGWTNKDSDYIVALPVGVWNRIGGSVSNGNIVCGKKLKVSNGKTAIEVEITDQCPSCDDKHLDLSPSAFKALGDESAGVLKVDWGWVNGEPSK